MYNITDEETAYILKDLKDKGIETEDLQLNLLDHICCLIESDLEEHGDFQKFYSRIIKRFYHGNLSEIESETQSLLNNKHYYSMKKLMFISGMFSAMVMSAGILFKFMHWPGAGVMIVLGVTVFSLLFLPVMLIIKYREKQTTHEKLLLATGSLIGILISLAIMFKIMYWPGANVMGVSALAAMILLYIPVYFISGMKKQESKTNTIVSSILLICGCGLFLALARAPHASHRIDVFNTQNYLRMQDILNRELNEHSSALSSTAEQNVLSNKIVSACEDIKNDILKWNTGTESLGPDFEKNNIYIDDGSVRPYFSDSEKASTQIKELLKDFAAYKNKYAVTSLSMMPGEALDFRFTDVRTTDVLSTLTQLQLIILQELK